MTIQPSNSFRQLFQHKQDPKIDRFANRLGNEGMDLVIQLRTTAFAGTVFENQRIEPSANTIYRKAEMSWTNSGLANPAKDESTIRVIEQIVLTGKEPKSLGMFSSHLAKQEDNALGWRQFFCFAATGVGLFANLFEKAKQMTAKENAELQSKIRKGICQWAVNGCEDSENHQYDCYLPEGPCMNLNYTFLLTLSSLAVVSVGLVRMLQQRKNRQVEIMKAEFNDPSHDRILNCLCEKNQVTPPDWSKKIKLDGLDCTIRTMMLILLSSCHDELYPKIFSEILPQAMQSQDEVILDRQA